MCVAMKFQLLVTCVNLPMLLNFSVPYFPYLFNEGVVPKVAVHQNGLSSEIYFLIEEKIAN